MATTVVGRGRFVLQRLSSRLSRKIVLPAYHSRTIGRFYVETLSSCSCQQSRCISIFSKRQSSEKTAEKPVETEGKKEVIKVETKEIPRENFVPITRRSLVRHLMQEKSFLTSEELNKFESYSLSLDSAIVNRYHGALQELKSLFDPINPDKDTIATRQWNRRERLDNEFWLIQKMGGIMEKANFRELPQALVEKALAEHQSREGVLVSVDTDKYDVLRFWALGRETPKTKPSLAQKVFYMVTRRPIPDPMEYYKRVVVAVRLKRDDKLLLKAFKEVPINALEQLLPDGKIKMSKFDRSLITSATAIASVGILGKIVTYLAHVHVDWTLIITAVTGLVGFRAWSVYTNRRNSYLLDLNRMLYFKNIANNRGLLALLVDRAEDELFKECLLSYTFLLTSRPPSATSKLSSDQLPAELGAMPKPMLEDKVEDWVFRKTGSRIKFSSDESLRVLSELGILSEDYDNNLHVLPLEGAARNLPITLQTMATRKEEYDLVEGFDRDITEETDDEYKQEEKQRKRFGWF